MATLFLASCGEGGQNEDSEYMSTYGEEVDTDAMVIDQTAAGEGEVVADAAYWTIDVNTIEATEASVRGNLDQLSLSFDRIEKDIMQASPETEKEQQKLEVVKAEVKDARDLFQEARESYEAQDFQEAAEKIKEMNQVLVNAREKYLMVASGIIVGMERENKDY